MILVTGATGHYGNATINFLLEKGFQADQIKALVRHESAGEQFSSKGINTVTGDYDHYESLVNSFTGTEKLLFISGSDIVNRLAQHERIIQAAKDARVHHIVYTSFQRKNETDTSPLWLVAQSHLQTEKWLKESGIDFTILKNNLYMDFIPAFVGEQVLTSGAIYLPAQFGKVGAILRSELAEATANILIGGNHEGKSYDFTNTEAFTYEDVAKIISDVTGKPIQYVSPTADEYAETMSKHGVPAEVIGLFSSFAVAQAEGELELESQDVALLLGRKPTSIKTFLSQVYQ